MFKMDIRTFRYDYKVDTPSKEYITVKGIIMQSLKSIGQL